MKYWYFKCFDNQRRIKDGVSDVDSFEKLAIQLRQKQLQIITATTIDKQQYETQLRICKYKLSLERFKPRNIQRKTVIGMIIKWISKIIYPHEQ